MEFPLWLEDHEQADALLANACRPLVGLHMSARDATRRWSLARFAAVGRELLLRKGGTVVLLGEAGEWPEVDGVAREIGKACLNLAGKTSLPVLGGVIARLSVLLTNDSGPAHIAYALGTPTATIFGGGNPEANGPPVNAQYRVLAYEVPCRPCGLATCPIGYRCLEGVTVQQAVEAATAVMR